MSGQTFSEVSEQVVSSAAREDTNHHLVELGSENEFDITAFLERHGSTVTLNHDGQPISVSEAYYSCDGFARLVNAFGEAALSMVATQHAEQKDETQNDEERGMEAEESSGVKEHSENAEAPQASIDIGTELTAQELEQPVLPIARDKKVSTAYSTKVKTTALKSKVPETKLTMVVEHSGAKPRTLDKVASRPQESSATSKYIRKGGKLPSPEMVNLSSSKKTEARTAVAEVLIIPSKDIFEKQPDKSTVFEQQEQQLPLIPELGPSSEISIIEILDKEPDSLLGPVHGSITEEGSNWEAENEFVFPVPVESNFEPSESLPAESELAVDLPATIAELEQAVEQLVEAIEELEPKQLEIVNQILDEIVLAVELVHEPTDLKVEATAELEDSVDPIKEELRGKFIQLFEQLSIDYTDEILVSFVTVAIRGGMSEILIEIEPGVSSEKPAERGTHEVIKQILLTIRDLKKVVLQAYNIGRSAIGQCTELLVSPIYQYA